MGAASVEKEVIFEAPVEKVYQAITRYQDYPEFLDWVTGLEVLEQTEEGARIEYSLNLIKKIRYVLKMDHIPNKKVSWHFDSGDLFKVNQGSWSLESVGENQTKVTYNVEIAVKGFIPMAGTIVKGLTEGQLPQMLKAYEKKAQSL